MKKQSGFTLIELVIVVVILGFLAVTAIPKFLDLTDQAKQASVEGMAGGFATAVSLVRAQWEAEARPNDGAGTPKNEVNFDGVDLFLSSPATNTDPDFRPGYPMGTSTTNVTNGDMTTTQCLQVWNSIFSQPPKISDSNSALNTPIDIQYFATVINNAGTDNNDICAFFLVETLEKDASGFDNPANTSIGNNFTYDPASSTVAITINNN